MYEPLYRNDQRDWKYYLFGYGNSYISGPLQRQLKRRTPVPAALWAALAAPEAFIHSVHRSAEDAFGLPKSRLIPNDTFELVMLADDLPQSLGVTEFFIAVARITENDGWEQDVVEPLLPQRLGDVIEHFYAVKCGHVRPGEVL